MQTANQLSTTLSSYFTRYRDTLLAVSIMSGDDYKGDETHVLLVARENGYLRLDYGHGDFYAGLGIYSHVDSAMATVRSVLQGSDGIKHWMERL